MGNKKSYFIKLKEEFFHHRNIKKLRNIAGGDTFTIIYMKLRLLSAKNDGVIRYEGTESSISEQLSVDLDEKIENINMTLSFLVSHNLAEIINDTDYMFPEVCASIGCSGASAERMKRFRDREKQKQLISKASQCDACDASRYVTTQENVTVMIDTPFLQKEKKDKKEKPADFVEKVFSEFDFSEDLFSAMLSLIENRKNTKHPFTEIGLRKALKLLKVDFDSESEMIRAIDTACACNYRGVKNYEKNKKTRMEQRNESFASVETVPICTPDYWEQKEREYFKSIEQQKMEGVLL